MNKLLVICLISTLIYSCKKDSSTTPDNSDQIIQDYLKAKGLDSIAKPDTLGLYYIIDKQGTGEPIGSRTHVKVFYKGYYPENDSVYFVENGGNPENFVDSVYFDQSGGNPASFDLSTIIEGWKIGIPHFREGAKGTFNQGARGKLIVPSNLGYKDGKVRIFDIYIYKFY